MSRRIRFTKSSTSPAVGAGCNRPRMRASASMSSSVSVVSSVTALGLSFGPTIILTAFPVAAIGVSSPLLFPEHGTGRWKTHHRIPRMVAPLNLATAGGLLLMLVVALLTVAGVWQVGAWL